MGVRVDGPEVLTAAIGQVFVIGYHRPITVEIEARVQGDFRAFYAETSGACQILISNPFLPFPLPPVEVRRSWRRMAVDHPRVDATAILARGAIGLAGAVFTSMLEQVVAPVAKARLRTFTDADAAVEWLVRTCETGCTIAQLDRMFALVRGVASASASE